MSVIEARECREGGGINV